jgi:hypothetical protein
MGKALQNRPVERSILVSRRSRKPVRKPVSYWNERASPCRRQEKACKTSRKIRRTRSLKQGSQLQSPLAYHLVNSPAQLSSRRRPLQTDLISSGPNQESRSPIEPCPPSSGMLASMNRRSLSLSCSSIGSRASPRASCAHAALSRHLVHGCVLALPDVHVFFVGSTYVRKPDDWVIVPHSAAPIASSPLQLRLILSVCREACPNVRVAQVFAWG